MDEYISRSELQSEIAKCVGECRIKAFDPSVNCILQIIHRLPSADVQPLSVIAEHIKKRLYETAFNTTEEKARNAIADMAGRIDFWINELRDGDAE